jgi:hypothetical protein
MLRKVFLSLILFIGISGISKVFAASPQASNWSVIYSSINCQGVVVLSTGTVVNISNAKYFSYFVYVHSGSNVNFTISYEVLPDNTGDVSQLGDNANTGVVWTAPTTGSSVVTITATGAKTDYFSPEATKWIRFKMTGGASSNSARVSLFLCTYNEK